jgi:PAS domain S-box-containing protein
MTSGDQRGASPIAQLHGEVDPELFPLLVDAVRDCAIFLLAPDGTVASWNRGAARIKGYSAQEILGRHFSCFYTDEDRSAGKPEAMLAIAQRGGQVVQEGWRVRKDGSRFWADVELTALFDEAGALRGFAKVTRDLSERRTAEENAYRLVHEAANLKEAEAARRRYAFLAEASRVLSSSLDLPTTLQNIARLVVPTLGDYCVVGVMEPDGSLRQVAESPAVACAEPPALGSPSSAASEESRLQLPMTLGERCLGYITVGVRGAVAALPSADLETAEELARRAALSIGHARAHAEAQSQRDRLNALFMQAPAAVAIFRGPDHVVELANPSSRLLVGGRDLVGKPFREAVPELQSQGPLAIMDRVYETGQPFSATEFPARLDRGNAQLSDGFFNFVFQPTLDPHSGAIDGLMVHAIEVTDQVLARKQAEALAGDLIKAAAELERSVQGRDEFLSIASHELKTPLTPLQLHVQGLRRLLERDGQAISIEQFGQRLTTVDNQIERLTELVDKLLDISRITTGLELSLDAVDLVSVVREVATRYRDPLQQAGCALSIDAPEQLVGRWDRFRLDQVVTNLLANACKYGAGKPITVSVSASSDGALLAVRDQGIGIADGDHERIFRRFERGAGAQPFSGFGLGLWISSQVVRALGGTISVQSALGAGATFRVWLPLGAADGDDEQKSTQ